VDDVRFDQLAKTVAGTGSRRRLLRRALAAAPLVVGLTGLPGQVPAAEAKRRGHRQSRGQGQGQGQGNTCKATGQICGGIGDFLGTCCQPLTCYPGPLLHACQRLCTNDNMCREAYPSTQTSCLADFLACPSLDGTKCCVPKVCVTDGDCSPPFTCQNLVCRKAH
jgi:hypothetical protein